MKKSKMSYIIILSIIFLYYSLGSLSAAVEPNINNLNSKVEKKVTTEKPTQIHNLPQPTIPAAPMDDTLIMRADQKFQKKQMLLKESEPNAPDITESKNRKKTKDLYTRSRKDTNLKIVKFKDVKRDRMIDVRANEILVKFHKTTTSNEITALISKHKASFVFRKFAKLQKIGYRRVKIPKGATIENFMSSLKKEPLIEKAEPDALVRSFSVSYNDPLLEQQWSLKAIRASEAWNVTQGNPSVIIAVIDSGTDLDHPDLATNLVPSYNFINDTENANDDFGHGTQIAGIIAAQGNNDIGIVGVAPLCKIMPLKVLNANGEGTVADVAEAIIYAADNGCRVINLALGTYAWSEVLKAAVDYAITHNCVVVAAAGNNGTAEPSYPAAYPSTIAVAASDQFGKPCFFSNRAPYIDVSAPGKDVLTAAKGGDYESITGTSAAAAHVSGLVALIRSAHPQMTNDTVQAVIRNSAQDTGMPGWELGTGMGITDCAQALLNPVISETDVGIVDLSVLPMSPMPGQQINVVVGVRNHGVSAVGPLNIALKEGANVVASASLETAEPKEISELKFKWKTPVLDPPASKTLVAQIKPLPSETQLMDNTRSIQVPLSSTPIHDVGIRGHQTSGAPLRPGATVTVLIEVVNFGNQVEENVPVDFLFQKSPVAPTRLINLSVGGISTLTYNLEIPSYTPGPNDPAPLYFVSFIVGEVRGEEDTDNNKFKLRLGFERRADSVVPFHAHGEGKEVHQWIANEAYEYFASRIENAPYIGTYLGTISGSHGDNRNRLLEGTAAEDKDDRPPLYQECSIPAYPDCPYFRHFCAGADGSEIYQGYDGYPYYVDYDSALEQAENIWQYAIDTYPSNKALAFYYLGHVAHLVGDMTVPAHTHNDGHAQIVFDGDYYEETMAFSNNFELWRYGSGRSYNWWNHETTVFSNLYSLFYRTANYTEDYDSDDYDGDGPPYYNPDDYPETWHHPENVSRSGGIDIGEFTIIADDLMPYAMRRVTDLYRLFYNEVDSSDPTVSMTYPTSEDYENPTQRDNMNTFNLTATASDSQSGILKEGYQFFWSYWMGSAWSDWFDVDPSPTDSSVPFTPPYDNTLYAFCVAGENGGGHITVSNVKYLLIQTPPPIHQLTDDTPETFSEIPKDFSFTINSNDWCCVGIKPSTDHDVRADDNSDFSSPYASSTYGGTTRDFVVTNGHSWGNTTHYAQVYYGSSSNYTIEAEWSIPDLSVGVGYSDSIGSGEVHQMYEVPLTNGQEYQLTLDITSGSADLAVYVFKSTRSSGRRGDYDWQANSSGAGGDESLTFTADSTGDYGIAVINENASSANYTLTVAVYVPPDTTPPTPNPMTWETEPYETGTSSISMVATAASDASPPIEYEFDFTSSPTGGSGGSDRSWNTSRTYTDSGLQTNHQYGYRVRARDSAPAQNTTNYSSPISYDYTDIETPSGITFGTITTASIQASSSNTPSGLARSSSGLIVYNVTNATNSGWKQNNDLWTSGSLSVNTQYGFKAQARNGDGDPTGDSPTSYKYTLANAPGAASFSNVTESSIQANWDPNGNPPGTQYFCENVTRGTDSGWTSNTYWNETGLDCGTQYCYQVKAKNGDGVPTATTNLGCQSTLPCPVPDIRVSESSYDYNSVVVGSYEDWILTIYNDGDANLSITDFDGLEASDFNLVGPPSLPFTIEPNDSNDLTVRFTPSSGGIKTAILSIANTDLDEDPTDVNLVGIGVLSVIYVDANSPNDPGSGTLEDPYRRIQDGIDAAIGGVEVHVAEGWYNESLAIEDGKNIYLFGGCDANDWLAPRDPNLNETIIDANDLNDSVVHIVDANVTIDGFTITNGLAENGGGIYCEDSNLEILRCVITNNRTMDGFDSTDINAGDAGNGGGIYCLDTIISVNDCKVISNETGHGGQFKNPDWISGDGGDGGNGAGIYSDNSVIEIVNSDISNNLAGSGGHGGIGGGSGGNGGFGGGIYCTPSSTTILTDCLINGNSAGSGADGYVDSCAGRGGNGGGIYCSFATLERCQLVNNSAGAGGIAAAGPCDNPIPGASGGGLYCLSSAEIKDCVIADNNAGNPGYGYFGWASGGSGGGVFFSGSIITIDGCIITGNTSGSGSSDSGDGGDGGDGAGIFSSLSSSLMVSNSEIRGNTTGRGGYGLTGGGQGGDGAGVFCHSGTISNSVVTSNVAGAGGNTWWGDGGNGGNGAGIFGPSATITNCTIAENIAGIGGTTVSDGSNGSEGEGAGIFADNTTVIANTIIWSNSPDELLGHDCNNVTYCDIGDSVCIGGVGNISADPCFADPNNDDYHLLLQSLCIDSGDPNYVAEANEVDIDGDARIIGGRIDMGADEYAYGELSDFNGDGIVNFKDFSILAYYWMDYLCSEPDWCEGSDFDESRYVDFGDLKTFAENWLWREYAPSDPNSVSYTITATAGSGGQISPSGITQVLSGGSQIYTITANAGYHILDVLVDGNSVGPVSIYPFTNVTADHIIAASFAIDELDVTTPMVTNCSPQPDSIQVPLNTLIILHVVDTGTGVDANSVTIGVNNNIVYTGNTAKYSSPYGDCYRSGIKADYAFTYQSNELFDFDQTVSVTVNATDLAGNVMNEYSYSFRTEMRSFGENKRVGSNNLNKGGPVTVRDSSGNIWAAWHAGVTGSRDIYLGKLSAGADNFGSLQLTNDTVDQCNAAIAVGSDDKLYVAWQDNRRGNWDVYISTSDDGINWPTEIRITDSNDNQINPAIVVDDSLPNNAYIVWEDDRHGNQDIYVATSSNGFLTKIVSQITSETSDQVEPAIAADSDNTIYVVWTDTRNAGRNDIYGAGSNNGPWTNIPVVIAEDSQSSPAIATEAVGSILHLVWVDDRPGDRDIFYAKTSGGLPGSPLTGSSIIDDTTGADQLSPVIITTGYTGNDLKVFACWRDERNADADLYFDEISSGSGTNVFVGDDGTSSDQSEPAIGIDGHGHPYLVWTDNRNTNTDIYYAGSTFVEPDALASGNISTSSTVTVGTPVNAIDSADDVSVEVPQGAYSCEIEITISRIRTPQQVTVERISDSYEFAPSGIEFSQPVTIGIPYEVSGSSDPVSAYWYDAVNQTVSQQGITNVETIVISSTLHALSFKTTHFTQFFVGR